MNSYFKINPKLELVIERELPITPEQVWNGWAFPQNLLQRCLAISSMYFFWLGTVPSMMLAPNLFRQILSPIKNKLPKAFGVSLVLIEIMTISFRMIKVYQSHTHVISDSSSESKLNCH